MKTSKPVSTISYNTADFLYLKLKELRKNKVFEFWAFIEHNPEPDEIMDEAGKKKHFHVFAIPAKMIQTEDIREEFVEPDFEFGKPRKTLMWVKSNFTDWYFYAIHDQAYLAKKHQRRVEHYSHSEIMASDPEDLNLLATKAIEEYDLGAYVKVAQYIKQGATFAEMAVQENLPVTQLYAWQNAWDMLIKNGVYRNGHQKIKKKKKKRFKIGFRGYPEKGEYMVFKCTGHWKRFLVSKETGEKIYFCRVFGVRELPIAKNNVTVEAGGSEVCEIKVPAVLYDTVKPEVGKRYKVSYTENGYLEEFSQVI